MKRLVVDIETIPVLCDSATAEEAKKAALDALTGRIVCIGTIILDDFRVLSATSTASDDERLLLNHFWSLLRQENIRAFVAHNGLSFDLPYIWRRSVINQVKPSVQLDLRRYRSDFVYDTMCVWGNWESRSNASLNSLAAALGLGEKSGSGDQVLDLWRAGRYREIAEYCMNDCWLTYQCFCRMNFSTASIRTSVTEDIRVEMQSTPAVSETVGVEVD